MTSASTLSRSTGQSKRFFGHFQPNIAASSNPRRNAAVTSSFLGTQPRMTQVPPTRNSSATATLAPWPPRRAPRDPARSRADHEQVEVSH